MARIVSLGSALQDIYLIDHDDLTPTSVGNVAFFGKITVGGKVDIDKISYAVGGGGLNSTLTFSRFGHEAILLTNISRDPAGMAIIRELDRENVDSSYLNFLERKATGTSIVLLDSKGGERTILTYRGASEQFGNIPESDLDLAQPDWLYTTTLRGDFDTLLRFFIHAKELGTKIMFNPGVKELDDPRATLELLQYVDILNINKEEASRLVPGVTLQELFYHLSNVVETVIITNGSMGGIAGDSKGCYRFGIYEDKKVKDTTGAGDAFGSGFLAALASGVSFRKSLIFASANSTAVVSKIGANRGILMKDDILRLHPMPIQKL